MTIASSIQRGVLAVLLACVAPGGLADTPAAGVAGPSPWQNGEEPTEGVDYIVLPQASAMSPRPGRIEVVEILGYTCIHCANLQPLVNGWRPRLGEDVDFHYLPADFGGFWTPYALAFHAAELLGVREDSHDAMFDAVHHQRVLPIHPQAATQIADWHAARGVDRDRFAATMESFGVRTRTSRSRELLKRWGVGATPTIVVAGRYRVEARADGGFARMLHTVDWLIARERARIAADPTEALAGAD